MASNPDPTGTLARFVLSTRYEDLDPDLVHHVKRSIVDCISVALAALAEPDSSALLGLLREQGGGPQASIWGTGERLNLGPAALANGFLAHILDYDDTYLVSDALLHANAPLLSAALAVAEWRGASGRELIAAFAVGYETEARLARVLGRSGRTWHSIGTCGPFGAAASAGRLLGLDETRLRRAFGFVGTQASGTVEVHGSSAKGLLAGGAAQKGVEAVLLAARGLTAPERILEDRHGCFPRQCSESPNLERLLDGLGDRWELREAAFKAFACGIVSQPLMDGVIRLRNAHGLAPAQVASIEGRVNPYVLVAMGKPEPRTGLEGNFSVYHCAAVCLVDGAASQPQFSDERVNDPTVVAVRRRVTIAADPSVAPHEAYLTIRTSDGGRHELRVEHGKGTRQNPLTDDELCAKFRSLAEPVIGRAGASNVLAVVERLETIPDAGDLARATEPARVA